MYAPVAWSAVKLVPPTVSTSGSAAGRLISLTTPVDGPATVDLVELTGPVSPTPASKVTWRAAAYPSAELISATSALVNRCSPPPPLNEITSAAWRTAIRTIAGNRAASFAGLPRSAWLIRSTAMVASGATASTSSVSCTSSAGQPWQGGRAGQGGD